MGAIRQIGKIRRFIDQPTTQLLMTQMVSSRIDYCNSLLYGLPAASIERLQRLQNLCARIILRLPREESVRQRLSDLHWLPVRSRIAYKIGLMVFKALNGGPVYLADLVQPYVPTRSLRSEDGNLCSVPRSRLKTYGDRAFAVSGPTCWNALLATLRSTVSPHQPFKFNIFQI